jgi:hypothetical protein
MSTRFNETFRRGTIGSSPESFIEGHSKVDDEDLSIAESEDEDEHSSSNGNDDPSRVNSTASPKNLSPIEMVRRETKAVSVLRYVMLILLLASAIGISIGTYKLVTALDEDSSSSSTTECPSDGMSNSMTESSQDLFVQSLEVNLKEVRSSRMRSAFGMSAAISSFVLESSQSSNVAEDPLEWPFVTIPYFEHRSVAILATTDVVEVNMAPLLPSSLQTQFETYAIDVQQSACDNDDNECNIVRTIHNVDGSFAGDYDSNGDDAIEALSPIWQYASFDMNEPVDVLVNQLSDPIQAHALTVMRSKNAAVWSDFHFINELDDAPESTEIADDIVLSAPYMYLFYPIFDDFVQTNLVGSLRLRMDFTTLLKSAIPFAISDGMTLVIQSCSEDAMAYQLGADKDMVFIGSVDSDAVNTMKKSAQTSLLEFPTAFTYGEFAVGINTTVADETQPCPFQLIILPSSVAADITKIQISAVPNDGSSSSSNRAIGLTSLVAAIFFILTVVFLVYDWLVERRQFVVVNIATKSTAIVENLFPAQVRDRMLQNIEEKKKAGGNNGGGANDPMGMLTGDSGAPYGDTPGGNTMSTTGGMGNTAATSNTPNHVSVKQFLTNSGDTSNDFSSQPIADLFTNTTVLFADIAGFTAWSSQREPPQVFTLLETLYRSFDVIAKKLKVFKVET